MPVILKAMISDQREHMYAGFGETYLKVHVSSLDHYLSIFLSLLNLFLLSCVTNICANMNYELYSIAYWSFSG